MSKLQQQKKAGNTKTGAPTIPENVFKLENFGETFQVNEAVEKLTYRLMNDVKKDPSKADSGLYAAKFKTLFQSGIDELTTMLQEVEGETENLVFAAEDADMDFQKKLQAINVQLEGIFDTFKGLEDSMNKVGDTAVQIGDRLETVDRQRRRAAEAGELLEYFMSFNSVHPSEFKDSLLKDLKRPRGEKPIIHDLPIVFLDPDQQLQAAELIQKLFAFAAELMGRDDSKVPGTEFGVENVVFYRDALESELLSKFMTAKEKWALLPAAIETARGQMDRAQTNLDKVVSTGRPGRATSEEMELRKEISMFREAMEEKIREQRALPAELKMWAEILKNFNEGARLVSNYTNSLDIFLRPPLQDLDPSEASQYAGDLKELRRVFTLVEKTAEEQRRFVAQIFPPPLPEVVTRHLISRLTEETLKGAVDVLMPRESMDSQDYLTSLVQIYDMCSTFIAKLMKDHTNADENEVASVVEGIFADQKRTYIDHELEFLEEQFRTQTQDFNTKWYGAPGGRKKQIMSAVQGAMGRPKAQLAVSSADLLQEAIKLPVSLELAVSCIQLNTDAIKRCKKMSHPATLPTNVSRLFMILLRFLGEHLSLAVEYALDQLENRFDKPPNRDYLEVVELSTHVAQMLLRHFETNVLPSISSSLSVRMECTNEKNDSLYTLEEKIVNGLSKMLNGAVQHAAFILETEQKKTDYRPRDDSPGADDSVTPACVKCTQFLSHHISLANSKLQGKNREAYVAEFGTRFYDVLSAHLKRQQISFGGSVRLIRDVMEYSTSMEKLRVPSVDESMLFLQKICKIFSVPAASLGTLLNEDPLNSMKPEEILCFFRMRVDFKTEKLHRLVQVDVAPISKVL